jgi:hypothetical protein
MRELGLCSILSRNSERCFLKKGLVSHDQYDEVKLELRESKARVIEHLALSS